MLSSKIYAIKNQDINGWVFNSIFARIIMLE